MIGDRDDDDDCDKDDDDCDEVNTPFWADVRIVRLPLFLNIPVGSIFDLGGGLSNEEERWCSTCDADFGICSA